MASIPQLAAHLLHVLSLLVTLFCSCLGALSLPSFWQHELPLSTMPPAFAKLASPLSALRTQHYLAALHANTLASRNDEFCSSAGIYCPMKAVTVFGPQPRACVPPFLYEYGVLPCPHRAADLVSAVQSSGSMFFSRDSLSVNKAVKLPNTANSLNGLRFLPGALAKALPELREQNMQELAKFYGIKEGSDMQSGMKVTLAHCGYQSVHELKTCHISGEGMVSFIANTVGHDTTVYTSPVVAMQEATVVGMSALSPKGSKVASCHDIQFPSLLYSCHMTGTSEVLNVALKLADGKVVQMPAICHMDTSYWEPSHIAFQVLKMEPGKGSVCHWFPENSFIFVQGAK